MHKRKIATTDIEVSILGLGTVKLGRNLGVKYPSTFYIPTDQQALKVLSAAADCGINLIDTAPAYGNSEERLGKLLPQTRMEWIIATKAGEIFDPNTGTSSYNFTPEFLQHSVETSLKNLGRDVLDIVLIHSNGEDEKIITQDGALELLNHLKQKGWIRASGMSTKTVDGGILAAQQSDIVMATHNMEYQEEKAVIDYAHQHQKGILIKKALNSGHYAHGKNNADPVQKSFEFIFQSPSVSSIILGSINPSHIKSNAAKAITAFERNKKPY